MPRIEGIRIRNFRALRDVTLGRLVNTQKTEPLAPFTAVIGQVPRLLTDHQTSNESREPDKTPLENPRPPNITIWDDIQQHPQIAASHHFRDGRCSSDVMPDRVPVSQRNSVRQVRAPTQRWFSHPDDTPRDRACDLLQRSADHDLAQLRHPPQSATIQLNDVHPQRPAFDTGNA